MFKLFKESLLDEDDKGSSPRLNSFLLTCSGCLVIIAGVFLTAFVKDVSTYVGVAGGLAFGKSWAITKAAQAKSEAVKVAKIKQDGKVEAGGKPKSTP